MATEVSEEGEGALEQSLPCNLWRLLVGQLPACSLQNPKLQQMAVPQRGHDSEKPKQQQSTTGGTTPHRTDPCWSSLGKAAAHRKDSG